MNKYIKIIKCFLGLHNWKLLIWGQAAHCFYRFKCLDCNAKKEMEFFPNGDIIKRKFWTTTKNEY